MIIPGTGYEFMRDINNQNSGDWQELYFYMNSGHTQTETFRQGFHGPYALWFTADATPANFDTTFWATLPNISGFVAQTARGRVIGARPATSALHFLPQLASDGATAPRNTGSARTPAGTTLARS
jgi:rhamnogalacturonan endolyase